MYLAGSCNRTLIKINLAAKDENEELKKHQSFTLVPTRKTFIDFKPFKHLLLEYKHVIDTIDIASTGTLLSYDIICLTKAQTVPNQNAVNIENSFSNFSVIFNYGEKKFRILEFCHAQSAKILNCINMKGISIFTIRIGTFRKEGIKIALLYKESAISPTTYLNQLSQITVNFDVDMKLENSVLIILPHTDPS